jgi:hypothetical protein
MGADAQLRAVRLPLKPSATSNHVVACALVTLHAPTRRRGFQGGAVLQQVGVSGVGKGNGWAQNDTCVWGGGGYATGNCFGS